MQGFVIKAYSKTAIIVTQKKVKHPKYKKYVNKTKKYTVHDPNNKCKKGDVINIIPSRPYSCTKKMDNLLTIRINK